MKLKLKELILFTMLGTIIFVTNLMCFIPNTYTVGLFTAVYTVVYRHKALIPLYIYILLEGVYSGFQLWWMPYLYIWTVLWAAMMLIPKDIPDKIAVPVYSIVPAIHGLLFGVLYVPLQAFLSGFNAKGILLWIIGGLPDDLTKAVSNLILGVLVLPLSRLLKKIT